MSAASTLLDDMQEFITTLQDSAGTAMVNASIAVAQAKPALVTYTPITPPHPYDLTDPPEAPTFDPIDLDLPPDPDPMGELLGVSEPNTDDAPTFDVDAPVLDFGTQPSQIAEFRETAPNVTTEFEFPALPDSISGTIALPKMFEYRTVPKTAAELEKEELEGIAPTTDVLIPEAPVNTSITFDAIAPVNDLVAPTGLDGSTKSNFDNMRATLNAVAESQMDGFLAKINPSYSAQMAAIETQLSRYLVGGTGLSTEVEDAIYARAQAKNDVEAKRVQDAAFADNAARGFTLPSGVMVSAMARARQDAANNNAKAANEIAIAQAEMEQKNLQFAVTTSSELRKSAVASMLSFFQSSVSLSGMALDYAKSILGAVVQTYDTQVKSFTLKLEAYKTAASIYETKLRAATQAVEMYKAQIQVMETMTNIDQSKVDMYKAQIGAKQALGDLYKTQVETVVSQASLEKLKIDLFQSQVQTYAAQVQAKSAEWQGYQARLSGEESKVKAYAAQVDAYNGEVGAFKAKTEGITEQIKAQTARNNAVIQEYTARVNAYETDVKAKAAVASANIDGQRQVLTGYQAQVSFAVAQANLAVEAYKANVDATALNAKTNMDMQVANVNSGLGQMKALTDIHGEILKVYSGPASAAAAGMNSLASINFDE